MFNLSNLFNRNPEFSRRFSDFFNEFLKNRLQTNNQGSIPVSKPSTESLKTMATPSTIPTGGINRHPDMRIDISTLFKTRPFLPVPKQPVETQIQPSQPAGYVPYNPSKQDIQNYFRNPNFTRFSR